MWRKVTLFLFLFLTCTSKRTCEQICKKSYEKLMKKDISNAVAKVRETHKVVDDHFSFHHFVSQQRVFFICSPKLVFKKFFDLVWNFFLFRFFELEDKRYKVSFLTNSIHKHSFLCEVSISVKLPNVKNKDVSVQTRQNVLILSASKKLKPKRTG